MKTHNSHDAYYEAAQWRNDLVTSPLTPTVIEHVQANISTLGLEMVEAVQNQLPELAAEMALAPPSVRARLLNYCDAHAHALLGVMQREFDVVRGDFDFIRDYAVVRAQENYPITALLHGFRVGQRVCWEALCRPIAVPTRPMPPSNWRVVMALSVFTMEYTNRISDVLTTAYTDETRHFERAATHGRRELLEGLLVGDRIAAITEQARRFALDPDGHFIVFSAQVTNTDPEATTDMLLDATRRLEHLLEAYCKHRVIEIHRGAVIGVLCTRPDFDQDLAILLQGSADKWMGEMSFRVGISMARQGLENVQHCYQDAQHATAHATAAAPVARFCNISVFDHLVATAGPSAYRIRPAWLSALVAEDARMNGALLETIRAFVDCSLSAKATAAALSVHTNTVYHRLRKIEEITQQATQNVPGLLNLIALLNLHRLSEN